MAEPVTFDALSDDSKKKAMSDFIDFYIPRLRKNNLEILSMYKIDYFLSDINHFIFENDAFTPEEMKDDLIKDCFAQLSNIISTVNPKYNEDGTLSSKSWDTWYQEKFNAVHTRD